MGSLYQTIKKQSLTLLKGAGVFERVASSRWRSDRLLILCYHGISMEDEHAWRPDTYLSSDQFESRLLMLKNGGYNVLPLDEAVHKLYAKTLPPKSIVITFDDGLVNFKTHAVPLLLKYHFPATLYLTTYYTFKPLPVFPLLVSYLLWKAKDAKVSANLTFGLSTPPEVSSVTGRDRARDQIIAYAQKAGLNANQKDDFAKALARFLRVSYEDIAQKRMFHLLTPDEVRDISRQGFDIQLHTHRHRTPMDGQLFKKEVVDNREKIAELLGQDMKHFCYPSGVYRMHYLPILEDLGVVSATTCDHAIAAASANPLLLPRFLDSSNVSALNFESWLSGVSGLLPRRRS